MSNAISEDIKALVQKELDSANGKFPPFSSYHEAYAVILEEVEEAQSDLEELKDWLTRRLWTSIKNNEANRDAKFLLDEIKDCAMNLACEAIQVAAMCEKAQALGLVQQPTQEKIVYCSECKYRSKDKICEHPQHQIRLKVGTRVFQMEDKEYCSDGERRE